jgi:predicted exporter
MNLERRWILSLWLAAIAAAIAVVAHTRFITDLSAFLPAHPTAAEQLLVDQLTDGPASRLILISLEKGNPALRAHVSAAMARQLRTDARFSHVENGESVTADQDREFLFKHRYLLSDAINPPHFSAAGLRSAIEDTTSNLASSAGLMLKSLVPHDPTGEMLRISDELSRTPGPRTQDDVWISSDATRTLMAAQTAAAGSDTDAQEEDLAAIRSAFATAAATVPGAEVVQLHQSGPGVFAVSARDKIKQAATRLSLVSSILVICILLAVYRSGVALGLGLLPVATGALAGIAAVALGFGAVHGTTLGFGITLIGESVDYSIYFFISASKSWRQMLWPTIRLGMLTSVVGFASLLPSGFPGLAQLGLYSISGLIAAALVTRFVLPELLPAGFAVRDVAPLGVKVGHLRDAGRRAGGPLLAGAACALAAAAAFVLHQHQHTLWNHELSALSPVAPEALAYDATLRADLGTADVLDLVVVSGPSLEAVLRGAERAGEALQPLIDAGVIGGYDSPALYMPSQLTQQARRDALPDGEALRVNLRTAMADSELKEDSLQPFLRDVQAARSAPLMTPDDLRGTSLAVGFSALTLHRGDRWNALLALHAPISAAPSSAAPPSPEAPGIHLARVTAALTSAQLSDATVLDMKAQSDALYASYLREAIRLSLIGLAFIVVLLWFALRSLPRVTRVLVPLILAVLIVAAGLALAGQRLTLLHLVGMLLIVAVGSNYALFFDHENARNLEVTARGASPLTLASLVVANLSTVIAFGLLSFSQVPVLEALGMTVAPGAFLALVFSALLTSREPPAPVDPAAPGRATKAHA